MNTPDTEGEIVQNGIIKNAILRDKVEEVIKRNCTSWSKNLQNEMSHLFYQTLEKTISSHTTYWKERVRSLMDYIEHDNQCIISQAHRGRPTNDGGYETQYGDKWYRSPDKPECDCGLDTLLGNLK